jgi:hypothetical protein
MPGRTKPLFIQTFSASNLFLIKVVVVGMAAFAFLS